MKQLDTQTTTPAELFVEYCDSNFGKSQGNLTQFERFASYWEIFKFAYSAAWNAGPDHGYLLGANDEFDHGYRKGVQDTEREMQHEIRNAYFEGRE